MSFGVSRSLTGWQVLTMTRGQWRRAPEGIGQVICPLENCGQVIMHPDFARISHLNRHIRDGWRPKAVKEDSPLGL